MSKVKDYVAYFFKSSDLLLLILCLLTSAFGVMMVYSATVHTLTEDASIPRDVITMIVSIVLGLIACAVVSLVDYEIISKLWPVWTALSILLMVIVLIFGVAPSNRQDARTWLDLGVFYFQPSELVKIFFIITFSVHLDYVGSEINKIKNVALLLLHAIVPFGLVAISGDDGSALVFMSIAVLMLFVAGISWKYILGGIALVVAAVPILWFNLSSFQKERFLAIVKPDEYADSAYQQTMGLSALANGGFTGQGFLKGSYTQTGSVPVAESDMIFTVVGEEFGLLGCLVAIGLLIAICFRIIADGHKCIPGTAQLFCYGVAFMILIQTVINLMMVFRVGPVIGITLPFFSAGGSSSLCLYIGMGLVFSVYRSAYSSSKQTSFRLIGVRSPFNEDFRDTKSATDRKINASSNISLKDNKGTRKSISDKSMKKKQPTQKHARAKAKKSGPTSGHSKTYLAARKKK